MKYAVFAIIVFISSITASANRGLYVDLSTGAMSQFEEFDFNLFEPELDYKDGRFFSTALGYRFNVFHIEAIYTNLGDTGLDYGDYLDYVRDTAFVGLNLRWRWRWFSIAAGVGSVMIDAEAKDTTDATQTISHDLDEGENSYSAFRFSAGANFPISEKFNLYIESVGISWSQDDGKLEWTDSDGFLTAGEENARSTQSVSMVSFGLRYYFN